MPKKSIPKNIFPPRSNGNHHPFSIRASKNDESPSSSSPPVVDSKFPESASEPLVPYDMEVDGIWDPRNPFLIQTQVNECCFSFSLASQKDALSFFSPLSLSSLFAILFN